MDKTVAFVIVGWNNRDLLKECFDSVYQQTYKNNSIIYVDNDSSDDSVAFVAHEYPEAIIVQPGSNTGFAKGNNIGIAVALKDSSVGYIVLLNSDARIDKDWVKEIVNFASSKPKGALFQGTTLDYYDHKVIDSTHIYVSLNGQGTQGNWRRYYVNEIGPKKVYGVNAAACLITRSFIEAQPFGEQLFDEQMFMYLEDVDLVTRATVMGWDNFLVPKARAYHMGSASSGKNPGFSLYLTFRNNSAVLYKNFPLKIILPIIPQLIRGDIDTIRTLKRLGKNQAIGRVIKGRIIGILRLPLYTHKRHVMKQHYKIDNAYLRYLMRSGY